MACCGSRGSQSVIRRTRPDSPAAKRLFEYRGRDPLTLFGRVTGIRYHFPGPGSRVWVDPRDANILEVIRGLQVVNETPYVPGGL